MTTLVLDLGGTVLKEALFIDGKISSFKSLPSQANRGKAHVLSLLETEIKAALANNAAITNIGISTAGQVDYQTGSILYANSNIPDYTGTPLARVIQSKFNLPVTVENDVNAACLGEKFYGAGKNYGDLICLTIGTGIGGALVLDNHLYRGAKGVAGEFGNWRVEFSTNTANDRDISFEKIAATSALVSACQNINPNFNNGKTILETVFNGAKDDNKINLAPDLARELQVKFDKWLNNLCLGLTNLLYAFNPEALILGGGIMQNESLIKAIRKRLSEILLPTYQNTAILAAQLGDTAALYGMYFLTQC